MKLISEHLGQIIASLAAVALLITSVVFFKAPIGEFFGGIVDKEASIGKNIVANLHNVDLTNLKEDGSAGSDAVFAHNGPQIPEGAYYYQINTSDFAVQKLAEMPNTHSDSMMYIYVFEDYLYIYEYGSWSVTLYTSEPKETFGLEPPVTDKNQTTYSSILENINSIPVKRMTSTFSGCTSLTTAPAIPGSVTDMHSTFSGCTNLITAPTIPGSVTEMGYTFSGCTNLTGEIIINANITDYSLSAAHYDSCFNSTTKNITLKGSNTEMLEKLASTANNGNVTVG